jgi:hypothetical protein
VYSPIARCGKTLFSLTLAQDISQSEKTLYLNLESCSGLEGLLKASWREDMADLMHASRAEPENLGSRLESIVKSYGNLDICPPPFFPEDLRETSVPEWIRFFASLAQDGGYQAIVLDIGDQIRDIPDLLKMSSTVFFPILPDPVSRSKVSQFEKNLDALSLDDVRRKLIRLYLPSVTVRSLGASLLDDLMYGSMGNFVRQMQREQN